MFLLLSDFPNKTSLIGRHMKDIFQEETHRLVAFKDKPVATQLF